MSFQQQECKTCGKWFTYHTSVIPFVVCPDCFPGYYDSEEYKKADKEHREWRAKNPPIVSRTRKPPTPEQMHPDED